MITNIIIFLISIVLYLTAPNKIDHSYIMISFAVFLLLASKVLKKDIKKKDYFSFNIIFSFSFFLTSYCFPVFILGSSLLYGDFVDLSTNSFNFINFDCITKVTALCTVAFSMYSIAYLSREKDLNTIDTFHELNCFSKSKSLFLIAFFAEIGDILYTVKDGVYDFNNFPYIFDIFPVVYAICLVSGIKEFKSDRSIKSFISLYKQPLLLSGLVVLSFLFFGERGNAITIVLITMAFYTFFYKKLRLRTILFVGIIGTVLLFAIRETRNKDYSMARGGVNEFAGASSEAISGLSPILLFSDLIGATQELCYGYETTIKDGLSYPSQIVLLPFYPFPKMPTIISQLLYDKEPGELYGGSILNEKMSSMTISSFGSHIVADIFMRWGLMGVMIAFFIFGRVVVNYSNKKFLNSYTATVFLLIMGMSVYIARSSITDLIRPIAYAYFFVWLIRKDRNKDSTQKNS